MTTGTARPSAAPAMAILVVCPGCTARFSVSDQFAGRTGPCPKCKKPITIPKAEAVTVHEPELPASLAPGGKSLAVPFTSLDRPVGPLAFVAGGIGALALLLAAWVVPRLTGGPPPAWLALAVAFAVGVPCAAIGYAALRNRELEAYRGSALLLRCLACAAVYAGLWAVRSAFLGPEATQFMWQWLFIAPAFLLPGALAALVAFDLDWGEAAAHFSFYVVFTALLRWLSGIQPPL